MAAAPRGDATRRTRLAGERTQLAWWRTGLTALAVGVGVGQVVPQLDREADKLPYVVLGTGFALYGLLLIVYGAARGRSVDAAVGRGGYRPLGLLTSGGLALGGVLLALGTIALIILS